MRLRTHVGSSRLSCHCRILPRRSRHVSRGKHSRPSRCVHVRPTSVTIDHHHVHAGDADAPPHPPRRLVQLDRRHGQCRLCRRRPRPTAHRTAQVVAEDRQTGGRRRAARRRGRGAGDAPEQSTDQGAGPRGPGDARPVQRRQLLRVMPLQKFSHVIADWLFPINANPQLGEYRYLRFAWKKVGRGQGIMLQLLGDNRGTPSTATPRGSTPWAGSRSAWRYLQASAGMGRRHPRSLPGLRRLHAHGPGLHRRRRRSGPVRPHYLGRTLADLDALRPIDAGKRRLEAQTLAELDQLWRDLAYHDAAIAAPALAVGSGPTGHARLPQAAALAAKVSPMREGTQEAGRRPQCRRFRRPRGGHQVPGNTGDDAPGLARARVETLSRGGDHAGWKRS